MLVIKLIATYVRIASYVATHVRIYVATHYSYIVCDIARIVSSLACNALETRD